MEKHIVNSYDNELQKLKNSAVSMMSLVKEILNYGILAIKNPKKSYVDIVNSTDKRINHFDQEIEKLSIQVIALRQPMAIDLRIVVSSLKLAVILERMGDLSKKISHRVEFFPMDLDSNLITRIITMATKLEDMLSKVTFAFDHLDDSVAKEISKEDYIIDEYYQSIMKMLELEIKNKPQEVAHLLNLVLVMRNLERIGDYIIKITYIIHFIITGNKIISS